MIERKIIIGLITSTEFCRKVKDIWNIQLIESSTAKRIASWCWEYFDKYGRAPGKDMELIYYTKLKTSKLSKDVAEEIEQDILPSLSEEYTEGELATDSLLEETLKHFSEQHIRLHNDAVQALLSEGKTEEAERMMQEFKPLGATSKKIDEFVLTAEQIRKQSKGQPILFMKPWLREGQTTILYGSFGTGKSWLALSIAYVLGLKDYDEKDSDIGEWQVKHPTGTLYVDGELGEHEMEERIKQFEWLGRQQHRLRILSIPEYQMRTEDTFYLSERTNQQKIIRWFVDHPTYRLIILDSVSTLFGLENENDNSEWNNKVNPLLRDLRALGVACILLHHAGKDGKKGLRGASAMGAMAHNIFRLSNHGDKSMDKGEAWFVLNKDKQRAGGYSFKTFGLMYSQNEDLTETHWEVTDSYSH